MTISEEVGLHQASPPLSYCGYWPACTSCEYRGTGSSTALVFVGVDTGTSKRAGTLDAKAPTCQTRGTTWLPGGRYTVSLSWYPVSRTSVATGSEISKVSVEMSEYASCWPSTDVRMMSLSPEAQRPMTYHGVDWPLLYVPCSSTWSQVPAGVLAFHDATSSVAPKLRLCCGESQVPYSQLLVIPVCGSV